MRLTVRVVINSFLEVNVQMDIFVVGKTNHKYFFPYVVRAACCGLCCVLVVVLSHLGARSVERSILVLIS